MLGTAVRAVEREPIGAVRQTRELEGALLVGGGGAGEQLVAVAQEDAGAAHRPAIDPEDAAQGGAIGELEVEGGLRHPLFESHMALGPAAIAVQTGDHQPVAGGEAGQSVSALVIHLGAVVAAPTVGVYL